MSWRREDADLQLIGRIDELKGRLAGFPLLSDESWRELTRRAFAESVAASARLAGAALSDREVREVCRDRTALALGEDEQIAAGCADGLALVLEAFADTPPVEDSILELHRIVLRYARHDRLRARAARGSVPPPWHLDAVDEKLGDPGALRALLAEIRDALSHRPAVPVVGEAMVRFMALRPFPRATGRVTRLVATLLLLRAGYRQLLYAGLDRELERSRSWPVLVEAACRADDRAAHDLWMKHFLSCLDAQRNEVTRRIEDAAARPVLPPLLERVLHLARTSRQFTISDAARATGASRSSLKRALHDLIARGYVIARGRGKSTWYQPL